MHKCTALVRPYPIHLEYAKICGVIHGSYSTNVVNCNWSQILFSKENNGGGVAQADVFVVIDQ